MTPYHLKFIQIDRKGNKTFGNPEFTLIYTFFAHSKKYSCYFKYIVRAEKYNNCFAIKYYCSRNKHSDYKYSRVLNFFSAMETKRIMETCASVIPVILNLFPYASLVFNESRTHDLANYVENPENTQRYRIYIELVRRLFGQETFAIIHYDDSSSCIFINRKFNPDVDATALKIFNMFADIYQIEI